MSRIHGVWSRGVFMVWIHCFTFLVDFVLGFIGSGFVNFSWVLEDSARMQNEEGQNMDLYIPRKWWVYYSAISFFVLSLCLKWFLKVLKCWNVFEVEIFLIVYFDDAALPLTGWSLPRIMHLSRSMLAIWMRLADTLVSSPLLLSVDSSVPR